MTESHEQGGGTMAQRLQTISEEAADAVFEALIVEARGRDAREVSAIIGGAFGGLARYMAVSSSAGADADDIADSLYPHFRQFLAQALSDRSVTAQ